MDILPSPKLSFFVQQLILAQVKYKKQGKPISHLLRKSPFQTTEPS
jgi:hypothetical protein